MDGGLSVVGRLAQLDIGTDEETREILLDVPTLERNQVLRIRLTMDQAIVVLLALEEAIERLAEAVPLQ
jgi:hypothetical protein